MRNDKEKQEKRCKTKTKQEELTSRKIENERAEAKIYKYINDLKRKRNKSWNR